MVTNDAGWNEFWTEKYGIDTADSPLLLFRGLTILWMKSFSCTMSTRSSHQEDDKMKQSCFAFIDALHHSPLGDEFKNRPKILAVAELALQRLVNGPSQLYNQSLVETSHKVSRNTNSNMKFPEIWVIASNWTTMLNRAIIENATFGVYSKELSCVVKL